jgi:hypothetical protein
MLITLVTVFTVLIVPAALVVGLLRLASWRERARERRLVRQVVVTEAIDAELGAVVAPIVRRRFGGGWRVEVAVPFGEPALVGQVVALAHAAMRRTEPRVFPLDVVLTAQAPEVERANARFLGAVGRSPQRVRGREVIAWTGTTTSRASW